MRYIVHVEGELKLQCTLRPKYQKRLEFLPAHPSYICTRISLRLRSIHLMKKHKKITNAVFVYMGMSGEKKFQLYIITSLPSSPWRLLLSQEVDSCREENGESQETWPAIASCGPRQKCL